MPKRPAPMAWFTPLSSPASRRCLFSLRIVSCSSWNCVDGCWYLDEWRVYPECIPICLSADKMPANPLVFDDR